MTRPHPSWIHLLALLPVLGILGCAGPTAPADPVAPDRTELVGLDEMPAPAAGVVRLGGADGALPRQVARALPTAGGAGRRVELAPSDVDRAFRRLCRGEVDAVTATRPMTAAETALCRANGLGTAAFRVAADATVAAVAGGTDLDGGGDGEACLTAEQVAEARAGTDDVATLALVAGSATDRERAAALPDLESDWTEAVDVLGTERAWVGRATGQLATARTDQRTTVAEDRPPEERTAAADRVRRAEGELGRARAAWRYARGERDRLVPLLAAARRSAEVVEGLRGTVGRFSLGAVVAAGDLLRPLPVAAADDADADADDDAANCVTPDPATVADGTYPLAEPVFLAVTDRSLARPEVEALVRLLLTDPAPVERAGLAVLPDEALAEQVGRLDDGAVAFTGTEAPERPAQ